MQKYLNLSFFGPTIFGVLLSCFSLASSASDSSKMRINVKGAYHVGFLLPHRISTRHLPQDYTHGFELAIERAPQNKSNWEKLYNNPTAGISIFMSGVGNYDLLGNGIGIQPYLLLPIVKSEHFNLQTSWGWGLGYLTKHFDPVDNNQNVAIGSGFNLFASIHLRSEIKFNKRDALMIGLAYNHWSNSGIQFPNLGLNVPTFNFGFQHKFHDEKQYPKLDKAAKRKLRSNEVNEVVIMPTIGFRAYHVNDNTVYPAYAMTFHYARLWSQKWKVSAGLDFLYNDALARQMELGSQDGTAMQTGLNITYHQTIGPASIILGMGAYIYDNTLNDEPIYHRFGTRFKVGEHFLITTNLFTHWARSDHLEIGFGYRWRK